MSLIQSASSSNYPNIFRLFESERSTWHLRDDQSGWNWSCEWQEKSDEPHWGPALVRRGDHWLADTGPVSDAGNRIQDERKERRGRGYRRGENTVTCDNCQESEWAIWTHCDKWAIRVNHGDRGRDSVLDLRSTEVGVWHQPEHNMPRGESELYHTSHSVILEEEWDGNVQKCFRG